MNQETVLKLLALQSIYGRFKLKVVSAKTTTENHYLK